MEIGESNDQGLRKIIPFYESELEQDNFEGDSIYVGIFGTEENKKAMIYSGEIFLYNDGNGLRSGRWETGVFYELGKKGTDEFSKNLDELLEHLRRENAESFIDKSRLKD